MNGNGLKSSRSMRLGVVLLLLALGYGTARQLEEWGTFASAPRQTRLLVHLTEEIGAAIRELQRERALLAAADRDGHDLAVQRGLSDQALRRVGVGLREAASGSLGTAVAAQAATTEVAISRLRSGLGAAGAAVDTFERAIEGLLGMLATLAEAPADQQLAAALRGYASLLGAAERLLMEHDLARVSVAQAALPHRTVLALATDHERLREAFVAAASPVQRRYYESTLGAAAGPDPAYARAAAFAALRSGTLDATSAAVWQRALADRASRLSQVGVIVARDMQGRAAALEAAAAGTVFWKRAGVVTLIVVVTLVLFLAAERFVARTTPGSDEASREAFGETTEGDVGSVYEPRPQAVILTPVRRTAKAVPEPAPVAAVASAPSPPAAAAAPVNSLLRALEERARVYGTA
jgi:hypothetical protein